MSTDLPPKLDGHAEHALREAAPRVLGAVQRRCGDFAAAEDAVQDALLAAFVQWPAEGVPTNAAGWLYTVACRRLADRSASESARRAREHEVFVQESLSVPADESFEHDDTLDLLFTCCHPALTDAAAIALTLRAIGGLTTAEIGCAFLVPEATMAQRIRRAKLAIQDSGIPLAEPGPAGRANRLAAVRHVLYLVFNEGYLACAGAALARVDLSSEAIRLTRALHALVPEDAETAGLLALMLLTDARRAARTGPSGELIPLDEQDRGTWDRARIDEGTALVSSALARRALGPYQVQAAIAAVHGAAPRHEDTDWEEILALYGVLRGMGDNPLVTLNEAIAHAMVHGPAAGLERLDELAQDGRMAGHYRLDAARAHLQERLGDHAAARASYLAAATKTQSLPERDYLLRKAARLAP